MTEARLALSELLEKAGDGDFLRTVAEAVLQLLMEADVEGLIGAGRYERSGERTTWRNGHRDRVFQYDQWKPDHHRVPWTARRQAQRHPTVFKLTRRAAAKSAPLS